MKKKLLLSFAVAILSTVSYAQGTESKDAGEVKPFQHLEVGVTAGSTGIGMDVATPINKNIRVRAGFAVMPRITKSSPHAMAAVSGSEDTGNIDNLITYLRDLTSNPDIDNFVMIEKAVHFWNAKLLVDWYPFKNKHWHFTGGFYCGSKEYAKAYNDPTESTTMVAVNMYNAMYDQIQELGPYEYPTIKIGSYSFETNPEVGQKMKDAFNRYGRAEVTCGTYPDGTAYYLTPDPDGVIRARAESWVFKPYVGAGYNTSFGPEKRWNFGVELGMLFWSKNNTHVYTTDGVCLVHDIDHCNWGDIKLLKHMPIYPNLEIRLAYTIF